MQVFLIHRFHSRKIANRLLRRIATKNGIALQPILLDSSGGEFWRDAALSSINECEAVVIFDRAACEDSPNASWEIDKSSELNKPQIVLDPKNIDVEEVRKLCSVYHHDEEFNSFFEENGKDTETLYKMMVESSENLIQRRQRMNAFFITAIGSLLAIAGTLAKFGTIESPLISFLVLAAFSVAGLLLCNSWRNLIDNYGKLNTAKFRVILKLERSLSSQIYSAEWVALGKGLRPQKYQSFTATENLVPLWFALLIFGFLITACFLRLWG